VKEEKKKKDREAGAGKRIRETPLANFDGKFLWEGFEHLVGDPHKGWLGGSRGFKGEKVRTTRERTCGVKTLKRVVT